MQYGRYKIIKELGKGSMGVVYQALDPQIDRLIALKVLRSDRISSEAFVNRFMREAKAIGRLTHSGIVIVFDVGQDHDTIFISMEFLEGKPLNEIMQDATFTVEEIAHVGIEVAEALDYAHRKGIVHRDIKPSNIIIDPAGRIKITDFGIARIDDPALAQETQAGEILGTPAYMSPEQVLSQPIDGRSDLFSLGIILYEMAVGRRPFRGENLASIFHAVTSEDPPEPVHLDPGLSRELSFIIMKCLDKPPGGRFANGKELAEALRRSIFEKPAGPPPAVASPASLPKARKKNNRVLIAIMSILFLIGAAGLSAYLVGKYRHISSGVSKTGVQQIPPAQELQPVPSALGALRIETTPAGAQLFVDGEVKGTTPVSVKLPAGPHEVRLSLAEHGDWEAQVKVSADNETFLPVDLFPVDGKNPK